MKIKLIGICIVAVILSSCATTKVDSTNDIGDGFYAVAATVTLRFTSRNLSVIDSAKAAASSIGIDVPFAFGVVSREQKAISSWDDFLDPSTTKYDVLFIISTNIDEDYLASEAVLIKTGVMPMTNGRGFMVVRE